MTDLDAHRRRVPEQTDAAAQVTIYPDGPLVLRGDFTVRGADDEVIETGRAVALCRCGRSALKPLCDGSHKHARRPAAGRATKA